MAASRPVDALSTGVTVEGFVFPPSVVPPGSDNSFFLGGAGVRGVMIEGEFVKFTAIGVYMEEGAVAALAHKWMDKSAGELAESVEFFRDIVTGPFEKFIHLSMIKILTGPEFSRKVAENCVAICKALESYTNAEEKAVEQLLELFKHQNFTPGCSVLFKQSPLGSLTIAFGKHDAGFGEAIKAGVIGNQELSRAYLESVIGKDGVSPATRKSLATRLHQYISATLY